MTHDVSHCDDYKPEDCPVTCYRAQVTEDLKHCPELWDIPLSWAHFYGTQYCALTRKENKNEPNNGRLAD